MLIIIPTVLVFGIYYIDINNYMFKEHQSPTYVSAFTVNSYLLQNTKLTAQEKSGTTNFTNNETLSNSSEIRTSVIDTLSEKDKEFLCGDNTIHNNTYVKEYMTPILCSQPVGLVVDENNNVWIASGKSGTLMVFDTKNKTFDKIIKIPNWIKHERPMGSMIWELKFDKKGDLWFTDELSNSIWKYITKENRFENYKLPTEGGYPISIVFDSNNNAWFTEVFGKKLGFIETSKVVDNTTKGIWELDLSKQVNFQTMGPISKGYGFPKDNNSNANSTVNKTLWFSTATFPIGGQLIKYDITKGTVSIYDLTYTHSVPYSVVEDENGTVWANSHIANLFLSLDPTTHIVKEYATSNPSASGNLTTLPYYNDYNKGKIWFNEHYGNAIASFDPSSKILVEYYIPTQNPLWVNSSNPLKFAIDNNGSIWFTEWTENKLGMIAKDKLDQIPFFLSTSKDKMVIDSKNNNNNSTNIDVYIYKNKIDNENEPSPISNEDDNKNKSANIIMTATSSISKNGILENFTSKFSQNPISISSLKSSQSSTNGPVQPYKVTLSLKPSPNKEITPGNYTLTITARHNTDIAVSKIIDLEIK